MSLQIWLPLNGSLVNQGLSDADIIATGVTVNANGKIGKCYSFDGSDDLISINCSNLYKTFSGGTQQFSIAFWVYHADATRAVIFGDYGLTGTMGFNVELTTGHQVRFYWGANPDKAFAAATAIAVSTWTHIVLTYDGNKINLYKNGILQSDSWSGTLVTKNKTTGLFYLGRDSRTGGTVLNGRLNDFRIYDHCLSIKEVEEISKGLVLHYKLDNNGLGGGGRNLLLGSMLVGTPIPNSTNFTAFPVRYYNTSASTCTLANNEATILLNSTANLGIAFERLASEMNLDSNEYYTLSCEAKSSLSGANLAIGLSYYKPDNSAVWRGGSNKKAFTAVNEWQTFTLTFKPDADTNAICYCFTINGTAGGTETAIIRHCKLEKGSVATLWTPAPEEVGGVDFIEDSSGYGNNGILNDTTAIYTTDSARYGVSIKNNQAADSAIYLIKGNCDVPESSALTFAWWMKPTQLGRVNQNQSGLFSTSVYDPPSSTDYTKTAANMYDGGFSCCNVNETYKRISIIDYIILNEWHHYALWYDGTNLKFYQDGIEKTSVAQTDALKAFTNIYLFYSYAGGVRRNTSGYLSDFRIYATALTESQIKELYNTSGAIDNNGNLYVREVIET